MLEKGRQTQNDKYEAVTIQLAFEADPNALFAGEDNAPQFDAAPIDLCHNWSTVTAFAIVQLLPGFVLTCFWLLT